MNSDKQIVLSLFDLTTAMVRPWLEAGYECWCVDTQHPKGVTNPEPNLFLVGCDVTKWIPPRGNYKMVFAFPPCTDLAVSGARWFKDKGLAGLSGAIELFERARDIAEWAGAPWMIENPVSTISSYWRKPDHSFNPCDYAGYLADPAPDAYTKKTCLWTGSGFSMPGHKAVEATLGSKMHLLPPSEERANLRSATPKGFAQAVYEANK